MDSEMVPNQPTKTPTRKRAVGLDGKRGPPRSQTVAMARILKESVPSAEIAAEEKRTRLRQFNDKQDRVRRGQLELQKQKQQKQAERFRKSHGSYMDSTLVLTTQDLSAWATESRSRLSMLK